MLKKELPNDPSSNLPMDLMKSFKVLICTQLDEYHLSKLLNTVQMNTLDMIVDLIIRPYF